MLGEAARLGAEGCAMRYREDKPEDLDRARAAVAQWREQNPAGTEGQLLAALGPRFHRDYVPVLRAVLFTRDRQITATPASPPGWTPSPRPRPDTARRPASDRQGALRRVTL